MNQAIRLVAFLEAFKGLLVLAAATGLLSLMHRDLYAIAARLIEHAHLNPAAKYPQIFLDAARNLQDARLTLLALGAAAYAALRLVEAYGLFRERPWAEVLAAGSGAIYLPFEFIGFLHHSNALHAGIFIVNALVVGVMVRALLQRRRAALAGSGAGVQH
ncbi:DUF2127 domain-containing protein [Acidovorax sp. SUPP3334]|uniref:DUF2127 domain-containing protein n=1 Tax=Acidovorax sp. SUPP3334 TaxID=2920881 RepID=UPI0023DE3EAE|nr:DUF2127 domain-containing protein [Acidovorax sp. SUPP3334]GKT26006.1 DUF2127 domain-containing protein [Acidovorax sp. SUPP3334]